ncbi:MAG: nitrite/sulfite reductase, partial [Pseudomonadota bacterium]
QRIKLAAGVISADQVRAVCKAADRFGRGIIHLTTRGSMEVHWIQESDLPAVKRLLAAVGLTSRGACGGAVRGVTCGSQGAVGFPLLESLACRLHRYFSGNPRFERLPKKFKIGVEADACGRRHLIQDVGLVLARTESGRAWYDIWVAGGLGREPQAGFLLVGEVSEERVIPLIEAVVRVYVAHTPAGKRLKHLVREIGQEELRRRVEADSTAHEELPPYSGLSENLVTAAGNPNCRIEVQIFAGGLSSGDLARLADFADVWAAGVMMVTVDQNIAFELSEECDTAIAHGDLIKAGFPGTGREEQVTFRVCAGNHECRMGLDAVRDTARTIIAAMGPESERLTWAISGCPNSCTQPQLADVGIVVSRLVAGDDGQRTPSFDVYRSGENGLGQRTGEGLTTAELLAAVQQLG